MSLRRRKWYRRGRAVVEFPLGVASALVGAVGRAGWSCVAAPAKLVRRAKRKPKAKRRGSKTAKTPNPRNSTSEGGETQEAWRLRERPCEGLDSVIGLEHAKREILLRTVLPLKHPKRASALGITTGGGVLLWGPPGCGKTLLARGVAGEVDADYLHVRPSDIMSQRVGQAEKNVARLFAELGSRRRAVLFIDELDSLCPSRRRNRSTLAQRVISEFLSQLDGVDTEWRRRPSRGFILVIGAANWIEAVDEALLRPGRFDVRTFVGLPSRDARERVIVQALEGRAVSADVGVDELAQCTEGFSCADLVALVETAAKRAFLRIVNGSPRTRRLCHDDFAAALRAVTPSVSRQELARYASRVDAVQGMPQGPDCAARAGV